MVTGCGGKKTAVSIPPPPPIAESSPATAPPPAEAARNQAAPAAAEAEAKSEEQKIEKQEDTLSVPPGTQPILVETGMASWYGAPYHNRRASNGEIYDMNAMTAAHRTLPLGSIVRVTNVRTSHSAIVRITDRGPFVQGRIVDLSLAAAKKVDLWQPGIAQVRVEVLRAPAPLATGGRWAVQIGAFHQAEAANAVANQVSRRHQTAKLLCFSSPVGDWWVRVRVRDDDRKRAEEIAHDTQTPQGSIFLVRLD